MNSFNLPNAICCFLLLLTNNSFAQTTAQLPEAHGSNLRAGTISVEMQCVTGQIDSKNVTSVTDAVNVNGFAPSLNETPGAYVSRLNASGGLRFTDYFTAKPYGTSWLSSGFSTTEALWGVICNPGWIRTGCNYMHLKLPSGGYGPDYRAGANACLSDDEEYPTATGHIGYISATCCRVVVK